MLLGRMYARDDGQAAGGGPCWWQPVDAMVLAPGVRKLRLHAVQLQDELATGWGGVPVYDGVAGRLAAWQMVSGAHLRELREQLRLALGAGALPRPPEGARNG